MREKFTSQYRGVTKTPSHYLKPWKSQLMVGPKNYTIGLYHNEEVAARAWDNLAFYLTAAGFRKASKLNFPNEPQEGPSLRTQEILDEVKGFMMVLPEPVAKRVQGVELVYAWIDSESTRLKNMGEALLSEAAALRAFRDKISGKTAEMKPQLLGNI